MKTRKELVDKFAERGYTKKDAAIIVDDFIKMLMELIVEGEPIGLRKFGTFKIRKKKVHTHINGTPEENAEVREMPVLDFVVGKYLKECVRLGRLTHPND